MADITTHMKELAQSAWGQVTEKTAEIFPNAMLALLILLIGLAVASFAYFLCVRVLNFFAVDKLAGKTPLDRILKNMGITKSISEIIGLLVFWMTVLGTLVYASEILHLEQISSALETVVGYIPQVIAALLIVVFGMLLAKFLQTVVIQTMSQMRVQYGGSVGKVVQIIVLVFVLIAASEQLGFDLSFITTNVLLFIFAIVVVVGIGMVIASRTILENYFACQRLKVQIIPGQEIEIDDMRGKLTGFTVTSVILQDGKKEMVIPALTFFTHTYTVLESHERNG
jgi:hypothetical protein